MLYGVAIFVKKKQTEDETSRLDYERRTEVAGSVPRDRLLLHVRIHYEKKMRRGV